MNYPTRNGSENSLLNVTAFAAAKGQSSRFGINIGIATIQASTIAQPAELLSSALKINMIQEPDGRATYALFLIQLSPIKSTGRCRPKGSKLSAPHATPILATSSTMARLPQASAFA